MTDQSRTLIEEGRKLRSSGDRKGSLQAFSAAAEVDPKNALAFIECGHEYLHLKKTAEAHAAFERALAFAPDSTAALMGLGRISFQRAAFDDAERKFRRLLELDPMNGHASLSLGHTLKSQKRYEEAAAAFRAAVQRSSTPALAQAELAGSLRELGQFEEAIAICRSLLIEDPKNSNIVLLLARLLKQTGRFDEAVELLRQAITNTSADIPLRVELGHWLRDVGQFDEAKNILENVLRDTPNHTGALNALAHVFRGTQQFDRASELFKQLIELQPHNFAYHHALGATLRALGDHRKAVDILTYVKEKDPKNLNARVDLGRTYQSLGELENAISEFGQILSQWPNHAATRLAFAHALKSTGRTTEAIEAFIQANALNEGSESIALEIAHLHMNQGHLDEAEHCFRSALARHAQSSAARIGLGQVLQRQGRTTEAEAEFNGILTDDRSNVGALVALGHIAASRYQFDHAIDFFKSALEIKLDHAGALVGLAHVHRRRGNREAALNIVRQISEAAPSNRDRRLDVAAELSELGRHTEASNIIDAILEESPNDPKAMMQLGLLYRRQGLRLKALETFKRLAEHDPHNPQAAVGSAIEERALGHLSAAKHWLQRALDLNENHVGALLEFADIAMQSEDWKHALEFYSRGLRSHPTNISCWLGVARATFEDGAREEAFRILANGTEQLGTQPELIGLQIDFMRQLRDWKALQHLLDDLPSELSSNFLIWSHRVQVATILGDYQGADKLVQVSPASTAVEQARVALLRGRIAEAKFCYAAAIEAYREAIQLHPSAPAAYHELARATLMTLDLDTARDSLTQFTIISKSSLLLQGRSLSPSQNQLGQLIDEFLLDPEALASLRHAQSEPDEHRLEAFRHLVQKFPDYTPAAILAVVALRRNNLLKGGQPSASNALPGIPRRITQFWDQSPPDDVLQLMRSWKTLNPNYEWQCCNDGQARALLKRDYSADTLAAYNRARIPAQKADIFRLAHLATYGGIYADADDRCLAPLKTFIPSSSRLVIYQENYGSIGNNFIAATPAHPVILRALDLAVTAINRGDHDLVWLSTGPGLFTRAFALEWAMGASDDLLHQTELMDVGTLQRLVGIHCPVNYKSTDKHWSRAAFGRARRRVDAIS